MKNFTRLVVAIIILLNLQMANGQNVNYKGFELLGKNQETIQLKKSFTGNSDISPFDGNVSPIFGLALKANITFDNDKSLVRIILVDKQGTQYLIYETYPLLEDNASFNIDNLCEETGILNGVIPQSIKIEIKDASLTLNSITLSTRDDSGLDIKKTQKEKKDLQNNRKISQINKSVKLKGLAWMAGETEVSALTYAEKKKLYGQSNFPGGIEYYVGGVIQSGDQLSLKSAMVSSMVDTWDWRSRHGKNWLTDVKNQGSCGSCWAFASTGATEAQVNLFYNQPLNMDLSEQNILSCSGGGTCSGGYPSIALDYIKNTGIINEAAFPYTATDQSCTNMSSSPTDQIKIAGRVDFGSTAYPVSEDNLKKMIIKYGPLSGGLIDWSHAMTLVGWQVVKAGDTFFYRDLNKSTYWYTVPAGSTLIGQTVWIFKNSWGVWGDGGYVYVQTAITNFAWTHALVTPLQSLKQAYTVQCVDNDGDGYYWWGLGAKPANCPPCPDAEDGNDNDATLGPLDSNGFCIPLVAVAPVANFNANLTTITANGSINFNDLSTNASTSWSWSFPGGTPSTSTAQNPVVSYVTAGTYDVTLVATNSTGSNTITKTMYITVNPYIAPVLPVANFTANITTLTANGSVNFTDLSTNAPATWSWTFNGGTPGNSTVANPGVAYKSAGTYNVTLTVTNNNGTNTLVKSGFITVNPAPIIPVYCNSDGNASKEWIAAVSLNGINVTSSSSGTIGYADLTGKIFNVVANNTYTLNITPQFSGKANYEGVSVWIDFNHDADFTDAGDQVLSVNNVKTSLSRSITIPSTALTGATRMRVSMKRSALPLPCEIFNFGEVKDYTININASAGEVSLKSAETGNTISLQKESLTIYPNPANQVLNLKLDQVFDQDEYSIYNLLGVLMYKSALYSNLTQVDVSGLRAGLYMVNVKNGDQVFQSKFIKKQ